MEISLLVSTIHRRNAYLVAPPTGKVTLQFDDARSNQLVVRTRSPLGAPCARRPPARRVSQLVIPLACERGSGTRSRSSFGTTSTPSTTSAAPPPRRSRPIADAEACCCLPSAAGDILLVRRRARRSRCACTRATMARAPFHTPLHPRVLLPLATADEHVRLTL